jgi:hypothetical protein
MNEAVGRVGAVGSGPHLDERRDVPFGSADGLVRAGAPPPVPSEPLDEVPWLFVHRLQAVLIVR